MKLNSSVINKNNLNLNNNNNIKINKNNHNHDNGHVEISSKFKTNDNNNDGNLINNNINTKSDNKTTTELANFANFDEFVTNETDFFAAFNDNFNKNKQTNYDSVDAFGVGFNSTAISDELANGKNVDIDDGMGTFNTTDEHIKTTSTLTKQHEIHLNNNLTDNFEQKFASLKLTKNTKNIDNEKPPPPPPTTITTTTQQPLQQPFGFDDDDDGFADFTVNAFKAFKSTATTNQSSPKTINTAKTSPKKLKPILGSDFKKLILKENQKFDNNSVAATASGAATKINAAKFDSDFSKIDQFEIDLNEALQRSLVDQ